MSNINNISPLDYNSTNLVIFSEKNYDHDYFRSLMAKKKYIKGLINELETENEELIRYIKAFTLELLNNGKKITFIRDLPNYSYYIQKIEKKFIARHRRAEKENYVCIKCNNFKDKLVLCTNCHNNPMTDQDNEKIRFISNRTQYIKEYLNELVRDKKLIEREIHNFTYKILETSNIINDLEYKNKNKYYQSKL